MIDASLQARRALACLVLALTACAAIQRPSITIESLTANGFWHDMEQRTLVGATIDSLAERAIARGDRTVDPTRFRAGIARTMDDSRAPIRG